jgi:hypothetical protein
MVTGMNLRVPAAFAAVVVGVTLSGCAASYDKRMSFLDEMSSRGIEYRQQLQQQGTQPSEDACDKGWGLLDADPPSDREGGGWTPEWKDQTREAYIKGCLTGAARPKPDPSGVDAVTPVPYGSERTPSIAPSAAPSR